MKNLLLLIFAAILCNGALSQTNLYVDGNIAASGSGTSWATSFKTLGEALNVVNAGSASTQYNVNVAQGTYYPTGVQSGTDRDSSFVIRRSRVAVYGGYPSGGGTRNYINNPTILSGNINSISINTDNSYHVMAIVAITAATTDTVIVDGFNFTAGYADGGGSKTYGTYGCIQLNGGGIYIGSVQGKITIANSSFYSNFTKGAGGAILSELSTTRVTNCIFNGNTASFASGAHGGAVANVPNAVTNGSAIVTIDHSIFSNNTTDALGSGSAVYGLSAGLTLFKDTFQNNNRTAVHILTGPSNNTLLAADSCVFNSNTSSSAPAALWIDGSLSTGNSVTRSVFTSNTGGGAVKAGQTTNFTSCTFTGNSGGQAGGLYVVVGAGASIVKLCTFTGNNGTAGGFYGAGTVDSCQFVGNIGSTGGGVCAGDGTIGGLSVIKNSGFVNNTAGIGGAIYSNGSQITNCDIHGCTASTGGGIATNYTPTTIDRCRIYGNSASTDGGGIYLGYNSSVGNYTTYTVKNTVVTGNRATGNGGGIYARLATGSTFTNITIAGDTATAGMALYNAISSVTVLNSIIYSGANGIFNSVAAPQSPASAPVITYSLVQGGYTGTGNISADPVFVSAVAPFAAPTTAGNYALLSCSPAINAGLNQGTYTGLIDVAGNPRLVGTIVDMGAYEYQGSATTAGPITGGSTACVNGTLPLAGGLSGGTWTSSQTGTATVSSSGVVTGVAAGTTTITYTVGSGPCVSSATLLVTVAGTAPSAGTITGTSPICQNTTLQLTESQPAGTWSSSNSGVASISTGGLVSAAAGGSAIISYTVGTGSCSSTATFPLTVNAAPVVNAIGGSATICAGTSQQFTNTTTSGVWSSTAPGVATVSTTGLVTAIAAGTDSIKYTVTNGSGCVAMVYKIITVNAGPVVSAITGGDHVCVGSQLPLFNSTTPGTWSSSNTAIATIDPFIGTVVSIATGIDTISYTVTGSNGCATTVSQPVTIDSMPVLPPIGGPSSMCIKSSIQLTNAVPGGRWQSGYFYAPIDSVTGVIYGILPSASASMSYTVKNGACSATVGTSVTIKSVDTGTTFALNQIESNQYSGTYQWVSCPGYIPIPGQVFRTFIASSVGQYAVIINYNGCVDTSACINVTSLGINDGSAAGIAFEVYPNPARDYVTIFTGNIIPDAIRILDITGKELQMMKPTLPETRIRLSDYPAGIYQVEVIKGHDKQTKKLSIY